jgi:WD40 repeat protein
MSAFERSEASSLPPLVTTQIAVALGRTVYLWNAGTGAVEELCSCPNEGDYICSVAWSADGAFVALGTSDSKVQIWDAARTKQVASQSLDVLGLWVVS